jgi:CubicO group peptidase (beta-lactamase class C family)
MYSYAHSAPALDSSSTARVLNDETIFRTGSVSKLYTAYAIIVQAGIEVLDHPVTRYLPELAGNSREDSLTKIIWEHVTVGALAAHQGGSGGPRKFPGLYPFF